ncbi:MAG: LysR substrate-binding domain-containing protein [Kiloniellaceae bacterium]
MRNLTLQRLEVFKSVYEEKSVSAAARRLKLSQPTVSRHLRDFEAAIAMKLFELDKGRIIATAEAEVLYSECIFLSEGVAKVDATIRALRRGEGQPLSVMTIGLLAPEILPAAVEATLQRLPALNLTLDAGAADVQIRALKDGRIDVGLAAGSIAPESGLTFQPIGKGHFVCMVPLEHPLSRGARFPLTSLRAEGNWIKMPRRPIGALLEDALDRAGVPPRGNITANSLLVMTGLANRLRKCVVVDNFTAAAFKVPSMVAIPVEPLSEFTIFAVSRAGQTQRNATTTFVANVEAALARYGSPTREGPFTAGPAKAGPAKAE